MKRAQPPKGFKQPAAKGTTVKTIPVKEIPAVEVTEENSTEDTVPESEATPDEMREQLRELTARNCQAALREIEAVLVRRGLKIYPIVHVEGDSVSSNIVVAPK